MKITNVTIVIDGHPIKLALPIGDDPINTNTWIRRYIRNIVRNMLTLSLRTYATVHITYPDFSSEYLIIRENTQEIL